MNDLIKPAGQKAQIFLRRVRCRFKPIHLLYSFYALVVLISLLIKAIAN